MIRHFPRIFWWQVVRNVARHKLLALANVLSVALGVAVFLAIQIANRSANQSFAATVDLVAGKAQLEVRGEIDELLWPKLAAQPGVRAATGLVEGVATLPDFPGEYLRVLGVDLFSGEAFRTFELHGANERLDLESWMGRAGNVAVAPDFARKCGLKVGDHFRVLVNSAIHELTIASLLQAGDSPTAAEARIAVMDIGWAQELFGRQGRLSALHFLLENPDAAPAAAATINEVLPANLRAEPPRQRSYQLQKMLSAFQLNLSALSMVSLLVGVFLIYNTIAASVTRRRTEIGILRALGATRGEVRGLFLGEAVLLGICGIVLGIGGGIALAQGLVGGVAQSISTLYVLVSMDRGVVAPWQLGAAALFGLGSVLAGAWLPANEAARIEPIGALSMGVRAERALLDLPRWQVAGSVALVLAAVAGWATLRMGPAALGFGSAFFVLLSCALFAPGATRAVGRGFARLTAKRTCARLAADNLWRAVHRNGITVGALAVAIALVVGLTVMIFSFRESLRSWVERGVIADLFVAPASNETIGLSAEVPPAAVAWLRARKEVAGLDTFREQAVTLQVGNGVQELALLAVFGGEDRQNLQFEGGGAREKMARVTAGEAVAISLPLARRLRLGKQDALVLISPQGPVTLPIAGIYTDYSRDQGVVLMHRRAFDQFWQEPAINSLAVYLQPGAVSERLVDDFRAAFSQAGEFSIYLNRELRTRIFTVFDQTFAVTYVLRTIAVIVAIAGTFLSVTTLVAERSREIAMLRSIGASPGQVRWILMIEAALLGSLAMVLGLLAGGLLAVVLTEVINPAFFGWSITLQIPWLALATLPLWILPATCLAAWSPAQRASLAPLAASLREE